MLVSSSNEAIVATHEPVDFVTGFFEATNVHFADKAIVFDA